jgi:two-component system OmpR family sensor kinase
LRTRTDALRLWGDAERIRNLLRNLLGNALKYGPPDRPVAVQARRSGHESVIEVVDHGPGIHAEERERVFEPFVRGGRARAEGVGGTGLGLTIVREIVQAHHGRVALRPTPGGGTTVVVALPLDFREPLE